MGIRSLAAVVLGVSYAGGAFAQPLPPPNLADEMPPLSLSAPPKVGLGGPAMPGIVVSQALQAPVEIPPLLPIPVAPQTAVTVPGVQSTTASPRFWASIEYLMWWPKQQPLIPLLTGNNLGFTPTLDSPGTEVLIGEKSLRSINVPGGRFSLGANFGQYGIETSYFFLGTQNHFFASASFDKDAYSLLAIPFVNAGSGEEDAFNLRSRFNDGGSMEVFTSTRVTGWEALASMSLYEMPRFRIQGLAGYRYFQLNEGLLIRTVSNDMIFDDNVGLVNQRSVGFDEVTTSNTFHGGTVGTRTTVALGAAFFELDSKVSLGSVRQIVVRTGGTETSTDGGRQGTITTTSNAGLFVNATNAGRFASNRFAVLPETGMKLGVNYGAARLFFGYTVIYLNQAVRPSDQLDRTIDRNEAPSPLGRPSPAIVSSDFWVQGVSFGLELRY